MVPALKDAKEVFVSKLGSPKLQYLIPKTYLSCVAFFFCLGFPLDFCPYFCLGDGMCLCIYLLFSGNQVVSKVPLVLTPVPLHFALVIGGSDCAVPQAWMGGQWKPRGVSLEGEGGC